METKTEKITKLIGIINKKSIRIKELKIECGQQATKICVLNLRIEELETALRKIVVESGDIEKSKWPTQQQRCFAIAEQALKG